MSKSKKKSITIKKPMPCDGTTHFDYTESRTLTKKLFKKILKEMKKSHE